MGKSVLEYFKSIAIVSYNGLFQKKNPNREGWGNWFSRGIEEKTYGNYRGHLKKEVEFQWVFKES